jgi:hypothetical protein
MHRVLSVAAAFALALCAGSAEAGSVFYVLSLPANGGVGAITMDFIVPDGGSLSRIDLSSYTSALPLDIANSAFSFIFGATSDIFGFARLRNL